MTKKNIVAPYSPGLPAFIQFWFFTTTLLKALNTGKRNAFKQRSKKDILGTSISGIHPKISLMLTISSNPRSTSIAEWNLGSDPDRTTGAKDAILLTMPGSAFYCIFTANEIGMLGLKADWKLSESPFSGMWMKKIPPGTSWIEQFYTTDAQWHPWAIREGRSQ